MTWSRSILLVLFVFSVGHAAWAELSEEQKAREDEISQRAKQRQYPGGSDESDLKVQAPLPVPVRKVAPAVEEDDGSEPAQSTDD